MKTLAIIILLFLIPIIGFSQLSKKNNPNQFEFELYNGGSFAIVEPDIVGNFSPEGALGLNHRFCLIYNRYLDNQLSLSLDYGFVLYAWI
jgi:hypothetical protein